ncbi:hypothetical protein [Sphaerisporangium aureirubrum]|uniref:DUF4367 domain-containing protein n=1 Tax=Sphaerisporangium aureirubrum TaxID=1544736 RepID=A0ABW1NCL5_9ACTN
MGSHDELETCLRALGEHLGSPTPLPADVARAVRARLEGAPEAGEVGRPVRPEGAPAPSEAPGGTGGAGEPGERRWRRARRRWIAAGVAVLLAVLVGLTPQGQAAVERVLRFAGIELHIGNPPPLPSGVPGALPGETRVTLAEARDMAPFPFQVPAELGPPVDVRVSEEGRLVSMLWPGGIRLDAFNGVVDVLWRKDLGPPFPKQVTVGESSGWWINAPHGVTYIPRDGVGGKDLARVAGPTLVWQLGPAGYRLEGVADESRAKRIGESLR